MISTATEADIPSLHKLVQSCYRGENSKKGWTSEADLLGGNRTTQDRLKREMNVPGARILKLEDENGIIIGCVYAEHKVETKTMYVGMLCVDTQHQKLGLGKLLMEAVEDLAKKERCVKLAMTVISIRKELVAWYERRGYVKTGEKEPFPPPTEEFGVPKVPLEFDILEKLI